MTLLTTKTTPSGTFCIAFYIFLTDEDRDLRGRLIIECPSQG